MGKGKQTREKLIYAYGLFVALILIMLIPLSYGANETNNSGLPEELLNIIENNETVNTTNQTNATTENESVSQGINASLYNISVPEVNISEACFCDSCESCTALLTNETGNNCSVVVLNQSIWDYTKTYCIRMKDVKDKTFVCQRSSIDGVKKANSAAFYIENSKNVSIEGCSITDFSYGALSKFSSFNLYSTIFMGNDMGVSASSSNDITMFSVLLLYNTQGIEFTDVGNAKAVGTTIAYSDIGGSLASSREIQFIASNISENRIGISMDERSEKIRFINSTFENNTETSLSLRGSEIVIKGCRFKGGRRIIHGVNAENITISSSIISGGEIGIFLDKSANNNVVEKCVVEENGVGIKLNLANLNVIKSNVITGNGKGIEVEDSQSNLIANNEFVNNNKNAVVDKESSNVWNYPMRKERNIVGGPFIGGNYWSDFKECNDTDYNGICDKPYIINDNNVDNLPLASAPDTTPPSVKLVPPTPDNTAILYSKTLSVNVSAKDDSAVRAIYIYLLTPEGLTLVHTCENAENCYHVFGPLDEGTYFVNATAVDLLHNENFTETRMINLIQPHDIFSLDALVKSIPMLVSIALFGVLLYQLWELKKLIFSI